MSGKKIVRLKIEEPSYKLDLTDIGIVRHEEDGILFVHFLGPKIEVKLKGHQVSPIEPEDYGDEKEEKICNVCHKILQSSHFDLNQNGKNNRPVRRPSCKDCRKLIDGVDMTSADKKKWAAKKPHLELFTCPICQKTTIPGLTSKVVLNHDHANGKPSGWICDSCNTGLGRFKDDIKILTNAITYLQSAKD